MRAKKGVAGPSSLSTLLEQHTGQRITVNPIGEWAPDREAYRRIWTNYDIQQNCAFLEWEGLPNGLKPWVLNRMLYFRGTVAAFNYNGAGYVLPYVQDGQINPYGLPTKIKPITFNGGALQGTPEFFQKSFELPVNMGGDENPEAGAVLLYDSVPWSMGMKSPARFFMNAPLINDIADTLARINIAVVVSNKKIFLVVKDAAQADVARRELEKAFGSDSPFAVISSPLDVQTVQTTDDYNAGDLFNTVKNYDACRLFMNGIQSKSFGMEKSERLVTGELAGTDEQINLIGDLRLKLAQEWCDDTRKMLGWNVTVKKHQTEQPTDGNGRTPEEEAEFGDEGGNGRE